METSEQDLIDEFVHEIIWIEGTDEFERFRVMFLAVSRDRRGLNKFIRRCFEWAREQRPQLLSVSDEIKGGYRYDK